MRNPPLTAQEIGLIGIGLKAGMDHNLDRDVPPKGPQLQEAPVVRQAAEMIGGLRPIEPQERIPRTSGNRSSYAASVLRARPGQANSANTELPLDCSQDAEQRGVGMHVM